MAPSPLPAVVRLEIYLVKIPKPDTTGSEQWADPPRPFVVMSTNLMNRAEKHFIGVPFTTSMNKLGGRYRIHVPPGQVTVEPGSGFVPQDSVALADQVRAVSLERVVRKVGTLSKSRGADIENALLNLISPTQIQTATAGAMATAAHAPAEKK